MQNTAVLCTVLYSMSMSLNLPRGRFIRSIMLLDLGMPRSRLMVVLLPITDADDY